MAITFKKVLISTNSYDAIYWSDNRISPGEIRRYEKEEHPFPHGNGYYSLEDFINDVKSAEGAITFPDDTPQEVLDWVEKAIDDLYFG